MLLADTASAQLLLEGGTRVGRKLKMAAPPKRAPLSKQERLKNALSTHVMTLVLYDRYKKHGLKKVMADTNVRKSMTKSKRMSQGGGVGVGDTDNMPIQ